MGIFITTAIAYVLTGKITAALQIGFLDAAVKVFAFYMHERLWLRISFGMRKPPDYRI